MNIISNNLKRDFRLLLINPKDFLYSYKYSTKKYVEIYPYNPDSLTNAKKLIKQLKNKCPFLRLYLIGSVGLGIDGMGDIDLYITAPRSKFEITQSTVTEMFGTPSKKRSVFVEWNFKYNKIDVELKLTDPQDSQFKRQITLFNLLKKKNNLKEYIKLKKDLGNCSEREYIRSKMDFFERLLAHSK